MKDSDIEAEVQRRLAIRDESRNDATARLCIHNAIKNISEARARFGGGSYVKSRQRFPEAYEALLKMEADLDYISLNPK